MRKPWLMAPEGESGGAAPVVVQPVVASVNPLDPSQSRMDLARKLFPERFDRGGNPIPLPVASDPLNPAPQIPKEVAPEGVPNASTPPVVSAAEGTEQKVEKPIEGGGVETPVAPPAASVEKGVTPGEASLLVSAVEKLTQVVEKIPQAGVATPPVVEAPKLHPFLEKLEELGADPEEAVNWMGEVLTSTFKLAGEQQELLRVKEERAKALLGEFTPAQSADFLSRHPQSAEIYNWVLTNGDFDRAYGLVKEWLSDEKARGGGGGASNGVTKPVVSVSPAPGASHAGVTSGGSPIQAAGDVTPAQLLAKIKARAEKEGDNSQIGRLHRAIRLGLVALPPAEQVTPWVQ